MLLNSAKYDIIFVTETWLHSDFPDSLLLPNLCIIFSEKIEVVDMVVLQYL